MIRLALAVLIAPLAASAGPAPQDKKIDASFEAAPPAGWHADAGADGVTFFGPQDSNKLIARIALRWVAPGSAGAKDADAFVARLTSKAPVTPKGWTTGPAEKVKVAGRDAKRVVRRISEFVPPMSMDTKEIPMTEIHVVIPASKGFYTALYYAPSSFDKKGRAAFDATLKTFKPKL